MVCALLVMGGVGCDGDDTNPALPSPEDAGGDSTVTGAEGGVAPADAGGSRLDGATDAAPSEGGLPLSCASWRYPSPIVLEDLAQDDAGSTYIGGVWIVSLGADRARVFAEPAGGPAFRVYELDKEDAGISTLDGPTLAGVQIANARHFALASSSVTQVLTQSAGSGPLDETQIAAYLIDDALPIAGPLPTAIAVSPGWGGVTAIPFDESTVFDAVRYQDSTSGATIFYGLGVGLATASTEATLANASSSPNGGDFQYLAAAHANGNVYIFATNAPSLLGESVFVVPDTAVVPSEVTPRAFSTGDDGRMVDVAPGVATATTDVAYWSQDTDASSATLYAGQLTSAQLDTATALTLPVVSSSTDLALSNATLSAQWQSDEMMIIGASAARLADGGAPPGVVALWIDATLGARASQSGASALLQERTGVRVATASVSSVGSSSAVWDVAWIEARPDGTEALLYDELDCE